MFRRFLYSRWFFGLLVVIGIIDVTADLLQYYRGWNSLNVVSVGMDVAQVFLCLWIFMDINRRTPRDGGPAGCG
jgi:hypothetical protein